MSNVNANEASLNCGAVIEKHFVGVNKMVPSCEQQAVFKTRFGVLWLNCPLMVAYVPLSCGLCTPYGDFYFAIARWFCRWAGLF